MSKYDNVAIPRMYGVTETARKLGVATSNLDRVAGLPPARVTDLVGGRLWLADEIDEFAADRQRERDRASAE